jgi:hypothetical protein
LASFGAFHARHLTAIYMSVFGLRLFNGLQLICQIIMRHLSTHSANRTKQHSFIMKNLYDHFTENTNSTELIDRNDIRLKGQLIESFFEKWSLDRKII